MAQLLGHFGKLPGKWPKAGCHITSHTILFIQRMEKRKWSKQVLSQEEKTTDNLLDKKAVYSQDSTSSASNSNMWQTAPFAFRHQTLVSHNAIWLLDHAILFHYLSSTHTGIQL